jgi:hypothetical protein
MISFKKISRLALLLLVTVTINGCNKQTVDINVRITNEVINSGYIGNGAQWDAYSEAEQWGAAISESDWQKLYKRLDFMKPNFIRCMINSPFRYFDIKTGRYDKTRNIESLSKLLSYCQKNDITVLFGEFNPPKWSMKQDTAWINMAVDYLNYLVNDLGFTCIKYYNLFNEPDGYWSSTNGDYEMWKGMVKSFTEKMKEYPALSEKVRIAGPDVVVGYRNKASKFESWEWVKQSATDINDIIGLYDIHAYPGQHEVRSGKFAEEIKKYVEQVPAGKKIVLGEAGYKYYKTEDSLLMAEQTRRSTNHPFTKGSDCNMLVYDYFYGLDMPLLCIEIMNGGFSGMAVWMLDDAMHSNGDAGNIKDIKLWGMWNILGEEVFGKPSEEEIRPWFYTWSLMCRYFPKNTDILKTQFNEVDGVKMVAGEKDGKLSIAMVNTGTMDQSICLELPHKMAKAKIFVYREENAPKDNEGFPLPFTNGISIKNKQIISLEAQSFMLITEFNY